jgi:PAS domain S-box-containing protein
MDGKPDTNILYIEDEPALCELFRFAVEAQGYSVDVAATGEDGLALATQTPYDVVAVDYLLPDMTGIDIARNLLALNPNLPLLMITGKGDQRLAVEAMTLGVANYVVKDDEKVYLELIPSIIAHLLERSERRRHQAEDEIEIHRSRQQLKTATEMAKLGYWEWDEIRDCATYYSQTLIDILDIDPADYSSGVLNGETDRAHVHRDDRDEYTFVSQFSEGKEDSFDIQYRTVRKNGEVVYCREIGQAVRDDSGLIVRSHGTVQDITDRTVLENNIVEREAQLSQTYRLALVGSWIWNDVRSEPEYVSSEYASLLGYEVGEIINLTKGKDAISFLFVHPDDQDRVRTEISSFNSENEDYQQTYRVIRKDGTERTFRDVCHSVFDENGNLQKSIGCSHDITDFVNVVGQLNTALADAEQANQAKSEFLATMSHEFRTPLNAILGFSEMIHAQYFGPVGADNYKDYAGDIHDSGEHMLALVNDMLDVAAIEAGKRTTIKENVDVDAVLRGCINDVDRTAKDAGVTLSSDVPVDLPSLYTDRRSVVQIIHNLLSNAIKFTERGGTIEVAVSASDDEMTIGVIDSGIGIPPDRLSKITEPFAQAHDNAHIAQNGTGLGLSIVKSLVEMHGGELKIESEVQNGTIVTVVFPIQSIEIE